MKKKKGTKFNYRYQPEHGIYAILGSIIIVLSIFLFNNFGKCKIYSLSSNDPEYKMGNGLLVLTNQKSILKLSNIKYEGNIENVIYVGLTLCVDIDSKCNSISTTSSNSGEGMNLAMHLDKVSFDINEDASKAIAFTKKNRKNIVDNLYLKIDLITLDGRQIYDLVKIDTDIQYKNSKLFY